MPIPENVLVGWTAQGAVKASAETHKSIRTALAAHNWPPGMSHEAYLQGSYPNATNIRGDSDVDLVVETGAVFYNNLTDESKRKLGLSPGQFTWRQFRAEVLKAMVGYYGTQLVDDSGDKCIKVHAHGNCLPSDVIPAIEYRNYQGLTVTATGMTFWTKSTDRQIINFPKLHIKNGAEKNSIASTRYKPSVRMFKNARNHVNSVDPSSKYPSYFVECLLFNVGNECFQNSCSNTYLSVLEYLFTSRSTGALELFDTQNGQERLFGDSTTQWNLEDASDFIDKLRELWIGWK